MLFLRNTISRKVNFFKLKTVETANITLDSILKIGLIVLFIFTIVWCSIFLYVAFYYTYVPSIEHVKSVNLQFTPCDGEDNSYSRGVCSFLRAHVELTKANQIFMLGQPYKITLFLEVPESEPNKSLGMFMVCGQLLDKKSVTVSMACRSAMLKYRSPLVHTLTKLALAPLYVFDYLEEKQMIEVELYSDFEDDQSYPVTDIVIELKTPNVQVYKSVLRIDAHLSGLRYLMFHWPTLSAALGISFNMVVIMFMSALSWWHLTGANVKEGRELLYKKFKDKLSPVFKAQNPLSKVKDESGKKEIEEMPEERVFVVKNYVPIDDEPEEHGKLFIDLKQEPSSSEA